MSSKTNYTENEILKRVLENNAGALPASSGYLALFTTNPTEAGGGTEVTGGSYARVLPTWSVTGNAATNSADAVFPLATADWGSVTGFAVMSASSGGNMLYYMVFGAPQSVVTGNLVKFLLGDVDITEE